MQPSAGFTLIIIVLHAIALSAVLISTATYFTLLVLSVLLLGSAALGLRRSLSPVTLHWRSDTLLDIKTPDWNSVCQLLPGSFTCSWVIVLALKTHDGKRKRLVVARDTLDDSQFRAFRVWMRIVAQRAMSDGSSV